MIRIAYQGVPGAFSQLAARECFPRARTVGQPDFAAVVRAVLQGTVDLGILPITNSIIGMVAGAQEAMAETTELRVLEEVSHPIRHCLLALPGATFEGLRTAESHPAALAQCARFLSRHRLAPRSVDDTAAAAHRIAIDRDFTRAAVASLEAAEHYGLAVVRGDIADAPDNRTTFAIISRRCAVATVAA